MQVDTSYQENLEQVKERNEIILTIFTPTYNRAHLLTRCYESLQKQSNKNFIWMVIDDGSEDGTGELVKKWIQSEDSFRIHYYYKENGGLHTAYNKAIEHIDTELSVCIDSDDFMPCEAVDIILSFWEKFGSDHYAGIVGLDAYTDGKIIGDKLPDRLSVNLIDLFTGKYHITNGDRTNVVRSKLYREVFPMATYAHEKNFNPHYMHLQISKRYDFLILNKVLRIVEYQADGMTRNTLKQYYNSPRSFLETRLLYLSFKNTSWLFRLRHSIHLISSALLCHKVRYALKKTPHKITAITALPLGLLLSCYITIKGR